MTMNKQKMTPSGYMVVLMFVFVLFVSSGGADVMQTIFITFDRSCNTSSNAFCPNSPYEGSRSNVEHIRSKLEEINDTSQASNSCLSAIREIYCQTRLGECVAKKKSINVTTLERSCQKVHFAQNGCSTELQDDMVATDCKLLKTEIGLRKDMLDEQSKCIKSTNETEFCPKLRFKILEANNNLNAIQKEIETLLDPATTEGEASCRQNTTELLCKARGPVCSKDGLYLGHFVSKELCMEQLKCLNSSSTMYPKLVDICSKLPAVGEPTAQISAEETPEFTNTTQKATKTKVVQSTQFHDEGSVVATTVTPEQVNTTVTSQIMPKSSSHDLSSPSVIMKTEAKYTITSTRYDSKIYSSKAVHDGEINTNILPTSSQIKSQNVSVYSSIDLGNKSGDTSAGKNAGYKLAQLGIPLMVLCGWFLIY